MVKNSKFKAVTAFLVIMSILFATLFGFASVKIINSNKQIATLQAEIESQSDVIASLQSVDEKLSQLENQIESQADTINKLQNDLSTAQENAKQWESKYNTAKAEASTQKTCYLTFDDGPSDNTLKIIEILNKYNIKATFFVIGKSKTEYMKNIVDSGNAIALHSYSHDYSDIYSSESAYFKDLNLISDLVKTKTGVETKVIRFPGGSSNTIGHIPMKTLCNSVESKGYSYFDWNCDSGDTRSNNVSADQILQNIKNDVGSQKNLTVLMHDTSAKTTTVEALPSVIEFLQSKGYVFDVLTESSPAVHHNIN